MDKYTTPDNDLDINAYTARVVEKECPTKPVLTDGMSLKGVLQVAIAAAKLVDLARKAVIYGKEVGSDQLIGAIDYILESTDALEKALYRDAPDGWEGDTVPVDFRLLHMVMGAFGEGGEKMELLLDQIAKGGELNTLQFLIESGDSAFWAAGEEHRLGKLTGVTPGGIRTANMAKLDERVKGAFNAAEFLNRNYAAEDAAAAAALKAA